MEKIYKIYSLIDKNNPKDIRYIGLTKQTLLNRLKSHKRDKKNLHKWHWMNKIGKDNIEITLLCSNLDLDEACNLEILLIKEYRELGYKLTNISNGGDSWKGTKLSPEHIWKISKNHANVKGANNPMFGKKHKKETIDKIKSTKKLVPYKFTEERILNMKEKSRGEGNSKAILTEEKVLDIRKLSSEGVQNYILAKKFNMNVPAIWKIVNRYTWKHI